jgi:uncharacterized protein with von Willebrand factor type A (vWA) domain
MSGPTDGRGAADLPAVDVDGPLMLARAVGFARALKVEGVTTDPASAIDFARALMLVDIGQRDQVRAAGATVFVRRRDDLPTYDRVFDRFWRRRGFRLPVDGAPTTLPSPDLPVEAAEDEALAGPDRTVARQRTTGEPTPTSGEEDGRPVEGLTIAPDAYSRGEVIRHKEFDRMTQGELRDAERLIDLLAPRLERRPTRRHELHRHGRLLAPRAMFRRNLGTGGDLVEWVWRRPVRRPRPIVVICDISGSMERQSRLLLRFVQALSSSPVKTEAFVFGTRLTRVTRLIRDRDRDRGLARVSEAVVDWAGGTRIGDSFREFNQRWARRVLRTSGIVIVVSDGWDRGDPGLVREETARLSRNCHRLVWLNPLAAAEGYQPLAAGMAAAYPFIDDFVAAGTIASLERLGELLAGLRQPGLAEPDPARGPGGPRVWRARPPGHATSGPDESGDWAVRSRRAAAPARALAGSPSDPAAARAIT